MVLFSSNTTQERKKRTSVFSSPSTTPSQPSQPQTAYSIQRGSATYHYDASGKKTGVSVTTESDPTRNPLSPAVREQQTKEFQAKAQATKEAREQAIVEGKIKDSRRQAIEQRRRLQQIQQQQAMAQQQQQMQSQPQTATLTILPGSGGTQQSYQQSQAQRITSHAEAVEPRPGGFFDTVFGMFGKIPGETKTSTETYTEGDTTIEKTTISTSALKGAVALVPGVGSSFGYGIKPISSKTREKWVEKADPYIEKLGEGVKQTIITSREKIMKADPTYYALRSRGFTPEKATKTIIEPTTKVAEWEGAVTKEYVRSFVKYPEVAIATAGVGLAVGGGARIGAGVLSKVAPGTATRVGKYAPGIAKGIVGTVMAADFGKNIATSETLEEAGAKQGRSWATFTSFGLGASAGWKGVGVVVSRFGKATDVLATVSDTTSVANAERSFSLSDITGRANIQGQTYSIKGAGADYVTATKPGQRLFSFEGYDVMGGSGAYASKGARTYNIFRGNKLVGTASAESGGVVFVEGNVAKGIQSTKLTPSTGKVKDTLSTFMELQIQPKTSVMTGRETTKNIFGKFRPSGESFGVTEEQAMISQGENVITKFKTVFGKKGVKSFSNDYSVPEAPDITKDVFRNYGGGTTGTVTGTKTIPGSTQSQVESEVSQIFKNVAKQNLKTPPPSGLRTTGSLFTITPGKQVTSTKTKVDTKLETTQIQITNQDIIPQLKLREGTRVREATRQADIISPLTIPKVREGTLVTTLITPKLREGTRTKTRTTTTPFPRRPIVDTFTIKTPGLIAFPLIPALPLFKDTSKRTKGSKRKYKYTSSFYANLLGITGKQPKSLTGLEIRPIVKNKKKKRKKKKGRI